jgi:N-succinyl-L-ornithine transcarbamylase
LFLRGNDAIARSRFCHYTSWRLRTQSKLLKTPRLSTIRIKHLKMQFYLYQKLEQLQDYGKVTNNDPNWTVTADKMKLTNNAKFMHCLPVDVMCLSLRWSNWNANSLVIQQANNRTMQRNWSCKNINPQRGIKTKSLKK